MKIAVISDIHGNLPALQAVLQDIAGRRIEQVYCLGDLVNFAPWPNEVIELIRDKNIPTLCGNHDLAIGLGQADFEFSFKTAEEREAGLQAIAFTNAVLSDDNREYLRLLPKFIRLEHGAGASKINILLTHGSPRSVGEYVFEDFPDDTLLDLMDDYVADVLIMGHTHRPYLKVLSDRQAGKLKYAYNAGSVGKPKDGDSSAAYLLLTLDDSGKWPVAEIIRVIYPLADVQQAILISAIPNIYATLLAKA